LLTSGFPGDILRRTGKDDPKLPLISKPYRRDELARMLRATLEAPPADRRAATPE
jgi:hypothetical protein